MPFIFKSVAAPAGPFVFMSGNSTQLTAGQALGRVFKLIVLPELDEPAYPEAPGFSVWEACAAPVVGVIDVKSIGIVEA